MLDEAEEASIRLILARALNENQILILKYALNHPCRTPNALLRRIEAAEHVPLSTLKLNAKILRELRLLFFDQNTISISPLAENILAILETNKVMK